MQTINCNTKEFWHQMCQLTSCRTEHHALINGNIRYVTDIPPEDMPNFIDEEFAKIFLNLSIQNKPYWKIILGI